MIQNNRMMSLGAFFQPTGHHVTSWRHPQAQADAGTNFAHYAEICRTAERGKFDLIFLADNYAMREASPEALSRASQFVCNFEPLTLLSAISAVTERIGLVATASTSYNEPFHIARKYASLDHLSGGRAGWNIVTSALEYEAYNFSRDKHYDHEDRYERAREFTRVVQGLWDSWDDDALVRDKESGLFFHTDKVHKLDHRSKYYSVRGPLNISRPPQGHPVLVQAGASATGRGFAAEFGEVIFSTHLTLPEAQEFYTDVKGRARALGRNPEHIKVLPGLMVMVAPTETEAKEKLDYLQSLIHPKVALEILSFTLGGADLSGYDLDGPLPELPMDPGGSQSSFATTVNLAREHKLTIRQLAYRMAASRQRVLITGSPAQIVDHMEHWFTNGAADGFNILPPYLPGCLDDFVQLVIPELQRRGLFRTEYTGRTLREHLGLPRTKSRYAQA